MRNVAGPTRLLGRGRPWHSLALGGRVPPCLWVPRPGPPLLRCRKLPGQAWVLRVCLQGWAQKRHPLSVTGAWVCGSEPLLPDPADLGGLQPP